MSREKQYYEITDAFLALKDIDDDEIEGMLKTEKNIREGKSFSIATGSKDLEAARNFLDEDNSSEEEIEVIDVDADSADHLKKNTEYIGQGILCCNRCKANRFIDMDLLVASEANEDVYNIEDECPHCHDAGAGYSLIGQVGKVQKANPEEETAATEEETAAEAEAEISNDEKSEDEATFDNDVEEEPNDEEENTEAEEETSSEEEEELPEIDTLEEEPEDDGMETDTSEDELEDLDLPSLGDEVDQDDVKPDEDEDVKESLNEEVKLNALAEEAWMMNRVIEAMNNEEAYYDSWLYIWPDGETREECAYDFGDQESFDELKEEFESTYRYYHDDGLYNADPDVLAYAHKTDSRLGLAKIENLEKVKPNLRESYECSVAGDIFKAIMSPENIDKVIVFDVSNEKDEPVVVFKGKREDMPMNVFGSPCKSFDVAGGHLSCNIDSDLKNTNRPLSKALECFDDEETEKISIWDQATGDEVFSGTKSDACNKFGDCEFISFETPAVVRICINNPSIVSWDEIEDEKPETDLDKLVKKIIDANNLSQYKTDKPNTNEYWIKNCLEENDDVELIYEKFVKPLDNKELIKEFKSVTGYNNPLEEAYEAGFAAASEKDTKSEVKEDAIEVTLDQVEAEVEKEEEKTLSTGKEKKQEEETAEKNESVRSFKSRRELAEAITECKNNSKPYTVKRSTKEGYRYDLITSEKANVVEDTTAVATIDAEPVDVEIVEPTKPVQRAQSTAVAHSEAEAALMDKIMRVSSDIADAIKQHYNIDADPTLIVADIIQDLRLISGAIKPEDLPDTLANRVTKEMFRDYEAFYETFGQIISALTGEPFESTPEAKLQRAIRTLSSRAFSTENIYTTIGSTKFIEAIRSGEVPYIAANDLPLIEEELEKDESITKEDILAWIAEHEQAAQDFVDRFESVYFDADGKLVADDIDEEEIKAWINEHEELAADFNQFFGINENVECTDVCEKCGKAPCECVETNADESLDVDTEFFDKEMNEYFNEAYEDTVIYTTTDGHVNADGTIVLEGLLQLDESFAKVNFTLTPEKKLVENLGSKEALTEVLNQKFTVTNNLSEEKFEFTFNK